MFECGVVNNADLAIEAHGSQQNGAILGNGCAIFLCKFIAYLVIRYNKLAGEAGHDILAKPDNRIYKTALTQELNECCYEDYSEHGRLLALKDILASLTEEKQLSEEQLVYMYAKDIAVKRNCDKTCTEETI